MMNRLLAWGLVLAGLLALTVGCSQETDQSAAAPSVLDQGHDYTTRQVTATLTQGTNLAFDINPRQPTQRVLSLQGQLFLVGEDGKGAALTDPYYDAREPQFSPDGKTVVFHGYRNGNWDIWQVAVAGGEPRALTSDAFDDREPQYAADGKGVVFSSDRGGSYDIWRVEVDSGELVQLTQTDADSHSPAINTQGVLAYVTNGAGSALVQVLENGETSTLTEARAQLSGLSWSPNDERLSFQVWQGNSTQIRIADRGRKVVRVASDREDIFPMRAAWVADEAGEHLVYGADGEIWWESLADTGATPKPWPFEVQVSLTRHDYVRRLRNYNTEQERRALGISAAVIDNTGSAIYLTALGDVWRWQPATDALENLTDDAAAEYSLALSPDGEELAFVSDRSGAVGLHVMNLGDSSVEHIALDASLISHLSWSPSGNELAFFVDVPTNPLGGQLMVLDRSTGILSKTLLPMPPQPVSWSVDGTHVAVTRLNPYARRFREGMYEMVVVERTSGDAHTILPNEHRSLMSAVLLPDGAMSFVEGARLWRLELDANLQPLEGAVQVTQELTDQPSWSHAGNHLVYLSGDRLMRMDFTSGAVEDVTPKLTYTLAGNKDEYVIQAGRVFPGFGDSYLENHDILVRAGRIEQVVPTQAWPEGTELVNAADKTVVPGLFEMHAHMGETSEVQGRVWLSNGITTVRDPGSNPYTAKERQEAWDSGRRMGPRTHITGYLTDGNRVFYAMAEGVVSDQHLEDALARTAALQLDFVKTYVRLPDHWQAKVVDFAHRQGIAVSSHELYPASAHGIDHVEHIGGTSRRGYQPKVSRLGYSYQDVVELLSVSGMGITATAVLPGSMVIVDQEADWFETPQFDHFFGEETKQRYLGMRALFGATAEGVATANGGLLRALTERDALLVTGTDAPFVPYGAGLHAEFRLYARAGLTGAQILHQATMNSAQAAGVANELGSIEPGKLADLVVVEGDPLADIRDLDQVVMTIKGGQRYPLQNLLLQN